MNGATSFQGQRCDMSPWHARLKSLAEASKAEPGPNIRAVIRVVHVQSAVVPANSWLGRARTRERSAILSLA
jgi:hypothetical protein